MKVSKHGKLINTMGEQCVCGNLAQFCGLNCAMFEIRPFIHEGVRRYDVILHCCKRGIGNVEVSNEVTP